MVQRPLPSSGGDGAYSQWFIKVKGVTIAPIVDSNRRPAGGLLVALALITIIGATGGATAQPVASGSNATTGTQQFTPDYTVRSAADLVRVSETASDGATVLVPSNTTITVDPDAVVFEQDDLVLYSTGGRYGDGGGTIRLGGDRRGATVTIEGENATVAGLRLIGPNPNTIYGESGRDLPNSFGVLTTGDRTRVYNTEVAGYTHAGIQFRETEGGHVYFSAIHHNTDPSLGYGVSSWQSFPLIQYNYFDANRHSIQTTRDTESGYRAEGNVVGPRRPNHAFDVHSASDTEAAYGGERVEIVNNTFLPPSDEEDRGGEVMDDPPITIDGRFGPTEGALIANNAFIGIDRGTAVYQAQENGSDSETFASDAEPSQFNNITFRANSYAEDQAAVPANTGAPDSLALPGEGSGASQNPLGDGTAGSGDDGGTGGLSTVPGSAIGIVLVVLVLIIAALIALSYWRN